MVRTTGSPLGSQAQHERASRVRERGGEEERERVWFCCERQTKTLDTATITMIWAELCLSLSYIACQLYYYVLVCTSIHMVAFSLEYVVEFHG